MFTNFKFVLITRQSLTEKPCNSYGCYPNHYYWFQDGAARPDKWHKQFAAFMPWPRAAQKNDCTNFEALNTAKNWPEI